MPVQPRPPDDTTDLRRECYIISSLNTLVAAINNEGYPTLASDSWHPSDPYPSDDWGDNVLNAVATVLVRKSRNLAAITCKLPANPVLASESNPCQIYIPESTESVTCSGSEFVLPFISPSSLSLLQSYGEGSGRCRKRDDDLTTCFEFQQLVVATLPVARDVNRRSVNCV
jgi:hypothetical protein